MAAKKKGAAVDDELEPEPLDDEAGAAAGEYQKRTIPFAIKDLPEGVKAVLRLKPWRDVKEFSAYIYRRLPDTARPGRFFKKFLDRVYNTEVEESWLKANYPAGGKFSVIYQMPHPDKAGDVQIHSDDYDIEPASPLVAPGSAAGASIPSQGGMGDQMSLSIMNLKALAEVIVMLKGDQVAAPAPPAWMENMYKAKLLALDEMEQKLVRKLAGGTTVHTVENKPVDELAAWPDFLRPFVPTIKQFGISTLQSLVGKLMGKGFEAMGVRALLLNNPAFLAIWNDLEKRNAAVASLVKMLPEGLGEELVRMVAAEMEKRTPDGAQ